MKYAWVVLVLFLAACAEPIADASPNLGSTAAAAQGELQRASKLMQATQEADAATLRAVTLQAQRTADAATLSAAYAEQTRMAMATQEAMGATATSGQITQAAYQATRGALQITQTAEWARVTQDWRVSGLEYDKRMTETWSEANATATAVAGIASRQKASDFASTLWKVVLPIVFLGLMATVLVPFYRYNNRRAMFVQYPAKNPILVVNMVTGEIIPLLPVSPRKALPVNIYDASRAGVVHGGQSLREQVVMRAIDLLGARSEKFPGYRELGIPSEQWQSIVGDYVSAGYLRTVPRQGTFLTDKCPTLADLYHEIHKSAPSEGMVQ